MRNTARNCYTPTVTYENLYLRRVAMSMTGPSGESLLTGPRHEALGAVVKNGSVVMGRLIRT